MKFMKPKYLALFIAAATSSAFAAAPGAPTIGYGNDKFALFGGSGSGCTGL